MLVASGIAVQVRVLWITGNFLPQTGGLEMYIDRLVSSLAPFCEVGLLTDATQRAASDAGVAHFTAANIAGPATAEQFAKADAAISDALRKYSPDLVHLASAGMAVYRDAIPNDSPLVATVHGNDLTAPWQRTPGRDTMASILEGLNACRHVIAISQHTAGLVRKWGVRSPVLVLTAGCDLEFFHPVPESKAKTRKIYEVPDGVPVVLTVGRLVARKGHRSVLQAIRRLPFRVRWLVVGAGPLAAQFQEEVRSCGMQEDVTLLARVSQDALLALYNACDVFVLAPEERAAEGYLDSEGFGLVFHEAMACGKPVLGSDVSGCRDAVVNGSTGILVPPGDAGALADAIVRVLTDRELAEKLAQQGHAFVRAAGGWSRLAGQYYELYEQVLYGERELATEPPDSVIPF
jgi:phosphatidyl-myo-inositol dimannoside synthase